MDHVSQNTFALGVYTMAPQALPHETALLRHTILSHFGVAQILLLRNLEIRRPVMHIPEHMFAQATVRMWIQDNPSVTDVSSRRLFEVLHSFFSSFFSVYEKAI